jgi:hypothetical protein
VRKKLLLALTLSFVFVGTAQAQAIFDRAWGAKAGVSVSSADVNDIDGTFDKSNQTGFAGGLFVHNYWGLFGGQLEGSYIQKGVKESTSDEATKLDYIELAALLKLGLPLGIVRPGLFGGIGFDILVSCKAGGEDCKDESKSTDWVGIIGGDVIVYFGSFSVFGDGRYNIGLGDVSDLSDVGLSDFSYKNQGWTFQAGVGFEIG